MLTKKVLFKDFNGDEQVAVLNFNLSKPELLEMMTSRKEGLDVYIERISTQDNKGELFDFFQEVLLRAYGIKSEDGMHFRKSEEIQRDFSQSAAYLELFDHLIANDDNASDFFRRLIPADMMKEVAKEQEAAPEK